MLTSGVRASYLVRLDARRRPTLPSALLDEAGMGGSHELVARADGRGRVVLEDPLVLLAAFQAAVATGKRERGLGGSLAEGILADRLSDCELHRLKEADASCGE